MDILELNEIIDRMPKTYSQGQKRRLELALGLIHRPDVLFLMNQLLVWILIVDITFGGMLRSLELRE